MRLVRRVFLTISFLLLAGGLVAAVVLPGPQHIVCPSCHGLEKIAAGIYVDPVVPLAERIKIVSAINQARRRVAVFFGPLEATPRIIVCRSRACARTFGTLGAKGVAFAWHAILLTNSRIFGVIAAHELSHVELHWRMGLAGWLRGTVPAWFDEGLATVISEDPRFRRDASREAVRDVMMVRSYLGQWAQHAGRVGWRTAYSAASTRVRQLERRIGRDGLKRFVKRLARDGDLADLLARARRGAAF